MIGLTHAGDRDYYCFCDTTEVNQLLQGARIDCDIYIALFNPTTKKLYHFIQTIHVQIVNDPATPKCEKIDNAWHFFIPMQYFSNFTYHHAVCIPYDISGNKLQIMDYTKCTYRLCQERDDILQYNDKPAQDVLNAVIDRDFTDRKDLGYKSVKEMTADYLKLKLRGNDD